LNCAGITSLENVNSLTPEKWDNMLNINLRAVFFCCQRALKIMKEQKHGKIVNISSNAGVGGGKAVGVHYSASKAGVICLTKSLALYAADFNVNVNCVAPGPTQTPMTDEWEKNVYEKLRQAIPFKRFAAPEEIAEAILFLASDKSGFITGETLNVNGGLLMD
jgi:NAD(P)-dependent dehydrogenase (short-subunit alcohol dehydrogenase family)